MKKHIFITVAIICGIRSGCGFVPTLAAEIDEAQTLQIESLIQQLDHRSFKLRRQAHQRLISIGEPALDLLQAPKAHRSAEVRYRVRVLIEEIRREILYTVTGDGRLIRLKVGKRNIEQEFVAKLGKPFDRPRNCVKGLAMSPTGMLRLTQAGWPRSLYRIDPSDGATTKIGTIAAAKINSLAFGPDGRLYGANWSCVHAQTTPLKQLVLVNVLTGEASSADVNVCVPRVDALAIDSTGLAVFPDECQWLCRLDLRINMASESLINHGNFGFALRNQDRIQGMCYANDGTLFSVCNKRESFLVRLCPVTGRITNYGKLGFETQNLAADSTNLK